MVCCNAFKEVLLELDPELWYVWSGVIDMLLNTGGEGNRWIGLQQKKTGFD
jgi:hypothetical protein